MNEIKRIRIENIKGKSSFDLGFTHFVANQPNIIVAPNGYGKSTLATAFKAASNGRMKLDIRDIYKKDPNNLPLLSIELIGENAGTYTTTDVKREISSNMCVKVINSSLYAKNTSRQYSGSAARTADLRVEDIVIYDKIPEKQCIAYKYTDVKRWFAEKGKLFLNLSDMLLTPYNIFKLIQFKDAFLKCVKQETIRSMFIAFLDGCSIKGTTEEIKEQIDSNSMNKLLCNVNVAALFHCIEEMHNKPSTWQSIDVVFSAIQLCEVFRRNYNSEIGILKSVSTYLEFKEIQQTIDSRLEIFNTTGREIRSHIQNGKLVVNFDRADSMSNGERDVLSFIVNISKFEKNYKKKVGILIIDEVFDYLDGSNLLAVQYYLSQLINRCKEKGKVLFPIILTHLDPTVFSNYYFSKMKIHYISTIGVLNLNCDIVNLVRLRSDNSISKEEKEEISKYYLHFNDSNHILSVSLASRISSSFRDSNKVFREKLYAEINDKYLHGNKYNPIMVIAGLRIRIEEIVYFLLPEDKRERFVSTHKVINKLTYAEESGVDIPEYFYLLQPLYNDAMHLSGDDYRDQNKIRSCYLKTDNLHIRQMIKSLFS